MAVQLWKDRKNEIIDPELFSSIAEALAKEVNQERIFFRNKLNNSTQIRKFFDEVIRYKGLVQAAPNDFAAHLPYIKMLNAKAAYAAGRELIGPVFKGFLSDSLKEVQEQKDFEIFCSFFEAFLGYYKYFEKEGNVQHSAPPAPPHQDNNGRQAYIHNPQPKR